MNASISQPQGAMLSGKTGRDENFPVASRLIAPRLRPHVAAFYAFARSADDIADAPGQPAALRLSHLDRFEAGLDGDPGAPEIARALRQSLAECDVKDVHARRLLAAFRRDVENPRCADWDDLMGYCALSAHPVGRYLLELHGEHGAAPQAASDALCSALQVLNHLQDITEDCRALDRIYLPQDWMAAEDVSTADLTRCAATPGLRRVIDRALDGCDRLLLRAADLPGMLHEGRLAAESAVIVALARRLSARLRRTDALAGRVRPTRIDFAVAMARGLGVLLMPTLRGGKAAEPIA